MSDNQISIASGQGENENLVVQFSKQDFSDFILSLVKTPQEHEKELEVGFDIGITDLRNLVDKLLYQVKTQNDVLNSDLTANIEYSDGRKVFYNSYEQLFQTHDYRREDVRRISMTISLLIGFNRGEDKKSFEKQTVALTFLAGEFGSAEISIRSTELTWPNTVFSLLESEVLDISEATGGLPSINAQSKYLPLSKMLAKSKSKDSKALIDPEGLILVLIFSFSFLVLPALSTDGLAVFDEEQGKIVSISLEEVLENSNWREAVQDLIATKELEKAGVELAVPKPHLVARIWHRLVGLGPIVHLVSAGVFVYLLLTYRLKKQIEIPRKARIFLSPPPFPERPSVEPWTGLFASLIYGIVGGILTSILMAVF
ncbi:hypothetical protein [uncultured Ruegeria sp.]|uniref:hypothetical protein n=1 Tax=uncultured Ruegeria sp. TaxID=259304 RepID=UPI0026213A5D|nr:hypothetical protein [uncultured Ruegeria sp.]